MELKQELEQLDGPLLERISNKKRESLLTKRVIVILVALLCCLLWGSAFPAVATGYRILNVDLEDTFQITLFAGFRFMISAILIFSYAFMTGEKMRIDFKGLKKIAILGLLQTFGQYLFFFLSLRTVHPANGAILASMGVFFTVIIAHFIYKADRLTTKKIWGLIIGMLGIVILNGGTAGAFSLTGEGFMMISMLLAALSGIYTKKLTETISPFAISGYQLLLGSILLISMGLIFSEDVAFTFTAASTPLLLYLGFISAAAFTLWSAILKYNDISKVSIYKFSIPIFGVLISFIFLHEALDLIVVLISMVFVATGIILINLESKVK